MADTFFGFDTSINVSRHNLLNYQIVKRIARTRTARVSPFDTQLCVSCFVIRSFYRLFSRVSLNALIARNNVSRYCANMLFSFFAGISGTVL